MSDKSVQVNIRASVDTAEGLRAEARQRRLPLGDLLAELLTLSRAERDPGLWLSLSDEVLGALKSVAAFRGQSPDEVLAALVRGTLRRELLQLAAALEAGDGVALAGDDAKAGTAAVASAPSVPAAVPDTTPGGLALHSRKPVVASGRDSIQSNPPKPASRGVEREESGDDDDLESVGIITVFD